MNIRRVPQWTGCAVAVIIFILGLGTLLPWSFIIATEYFDDRLKGTTSSNGTTPLTKDYNFASWMTLLAQLPLFTLANSFLYQRIKEKVWIAVNMVSILFLFLLTAIMVKVPMQPHSCFSITMVTIWFINSFGAVLQGSLFGLVGLLPPRYSTLFMSGQGLAGIFAALASLFSILSKADKASAALGYFITPCVATLLTLLSYLLLPHLIWQMALCVTCVLAVTLSVFPAVTVKVKSVYVNKEWDRYFLCVCCFIVFNVMDLIGRSVTSMVQWPSKRSGLFPVLVVSRVIFIPLIMLCKTDNRQYLPVLFSHDVAFVVIMTLFALSNGYFVCLCMSPHLFHSIILLSGAVVGEG
ncbi:equilibrative nucleoside transporter 2-like [Coregonus clupeaformis]|uniref:equilibrative nucleoside transporter 2-like n=1 Tax=Coregonus clupeaformis TaxID=59861 RepID=UPI001BE06CC0|nr:equilibrative nucleoside transporter 2-like [Coregonus clupeaformis]